MKNDSRWKSAELTEYDEDFDIVLFDEGEDENNVNGVNVEVRRY